jgi:hypothetical protein
MANFNGRVVVDIDVPAKTVQAQIIQCAGCGKQDQEPYANIGFWRCIPPFAGWNSAEENFVCLDCLNKVNVEIFGVPAKEL